MDPIGLTGTLIAIVQVSSKIIISCYEYHKCVKDALNDVSRIRDEATSIRNVAERLVDMAGGGNSAMLPSLQAMSDTRGPLETCLRELDGLELLLTPTSKRARMFVLKWPLNKPEADKSLATMGRIKSTLQLALAADSAQNIGNIVDHVKILPGIQDGVTSLVESTKLKKKAKNEAEVLRLLQAHDQESKLHDEFKKSVAGTGEWLITHHNYSSWKQEPGRLLWLHGIPGCGKTVLSSKVIKDLRSYCALDSNSSLCYFFINGSEQTSVNSESLHRSFVSQLIPQCDKPLSIALDNLIYNMGERKSSRRLQEEPRIIRYLEKVLEEQHAQFHHNYVVIDGLDECEDLDDLEAVTQFLGDLLHNSSRSVHLIVSSRYLERLQLAFEDVEKSLITIEGGDTTHDMQTALKAQLSVQRKFARWPASLKREVEAALLSQANGCFRWLECQLQELKSCNTQGSVREALRHLPQSLQAHYTRVLERTNPKNRASIQNLLSWVTFARRPLTLDEIATAITINTESDGMPFIDEGLELFDVEDFLDSCSSLVSVYRDRSDALGSEEKYVQLAHYSVKEYLVSEPVYDAFLSSWLPLDERLVHSSLARSCLAYFLQTTSNEAEDFWDENPLACYAGRFLMVHKHLSSDDWNSMLPESLLYNLFDEEKPYFRTWLKVADIDRPWAKEKLIVEGHETSKYTPIYCAAWYGFEDATAKILASGASPDGSSGIHGSALQAAANNGHLSVVKLLIGAKVNINAPGGRYKSAIATATARGHLEIVRELLAAGAEIQPQRRRFGDRRTDPLYLAVQTGSLEAVEMLLTHGATDFWTMKAKPVSALDAATQSGRLDIVKELLKHRKILEGNSMSRGCSALISSAASGFSASQFRAAYSGQKEILRELAKHEMSPEEILRHAARAGDLDLVLESLDKGAGIDDKGRHSDGGSALKLAIRHGHAEIAEELLTRGADPSPDALTAAVKSESLDMVQKIVNAGADVNPPGGRPLREAISLERLDIAELLVARGADMHETLEHSAVKGYDRVFDRLVKFGADLHRKDPDDKASLLQAAARGGSVSIVRHLLESGIAVDPSEDDARTTTPLMEAIRSKNWDVMRLLLDHGANVNAIPSERPDDTCGTGWATRKYLYWPPWTVYETPLALAARADSQDACFDLIRRGAAIAVATPITAGTPLLYAIWMGMEELTDQLLLGGADPNQQGTLPDRQKPSPPLLLAIEKRRTAIFHRLVAAGVGVNDQDTEGFSPLHLAAVSKASKDDTSTEDGADAEDAAGNDTKILHALIHQYHARVNGPRLLNGSQPIHSAAARGTVEHVRILLDAGAAIDTLNDDGRTPLHWAAERGKWDVIELLLEKGANTGIRSTEEGLQTPVELAHQARSEPLWKVPTIAGWDDARIAALLKKLEEVDGR